MRGTTRLHGRKTFLGSEKVRGTLQPRFEERCQFRIPGSRLLLLQDEGDVGEWTAMSGK